MPILIKDYIWRQTEDNLIVRVPLQNVNPSKVDLFTSDVYIKVHFPPFLFEVFLYEAISEENSKCTLIKGEAVFELSKLEKKLWPTLQREVLKKEMIAIKEEVIKREHEKAEINTKHTKEKKYDRHQECVKRQIEQETILRERIENLKQKEHGEALQEVLEWKPDEIVYNKSPLKSEKKTVSEGTVANEENNIFDEDIEKQESKMKALPSWLLAATKPAKRPQPRKRNTIRLDFTYRAFPTPSRESQLTEEEEWLKKQAEARRRTGFVAEDLRPEEKDPDWLLNKGKSFYEVGNHLGAISAFSYAIRYWDKIPELYAARAESHVALGNWRRVLNDASSGLDLCRPHVAANAELRYKCYYNRGLALIELGQYRSAVGELEEALLLRPYDEKLHHLMDRAENETPIEEEMPKIINTV